MEAAYICRFCALAAGWHMPPAAFMDRRHQCRICGRWRNVIDTEELGNEPEQ